jgi:crotonobetainyl-CoA:carnitine CoA-transferase CaiB-like acyl-CoA transferase
MLTGHELTRKIRVPDPWRKGTPIIAQKFQANREPVAPVLNTPEAVAHPHLRARGTVRKAQDPILGEVDVPGFPLRFSAAPGQLDMQAPLLGQHNAEVLKEFLNYSDQRIAQLKEEGVLVERATDAPKAPPSAKQA